MSVKALEKLRGLGTKVKESCFTGVHCDAVLSLADEIEAEIAERYMPLPVDADGVPIYMGDVLVPKDYGTRRREVIGVNCKEFFFVDDEEGRIKKNRAHCWKHLEPRTLEDVLLEFASNRIRIRCEHGEYLTSADNDVIAEYADRIRELTRGAR